MKLFNIILLIAGVVIFQTAKANEDCVANCVKKERDGQVLIYKWIDETGKTKKVFTVDLAENALNMTDQTQSSQSNETPEAPPADEQGTYSTETNSESYETTTEIVVITTTKFYYTPPPFSGSGSGASGGKTLYDIQVHTQRSKKNKSSWDYASLAVSGLALSYADNQIPRSTTNNSAMSEQANAVVAAAWCGAGKYFSGYDPQSWAEQQPLASTAGLFQRVGGSFCLASLPQEWLLAEPDYLAQITATLALFSTDEFWEALI